MKIITHRGLDTELHHSFSESSKEAFSSFLHAGFGLEFDVQISKDLVPVVSHSNTIGQSINIGEIYAEEFLNIPLLQGATLTLETLINLMKDALPHTTGIHALHLKHTNQSAESISILLPFLKQASELPLIVFDVKPDVAQELKERLPQLPLAASVAHSFDIERYNSAVGDTLLTVQDIIKYKDLYNWAWLDEWDRTDVNNQEKSLYNDETFLELRSHGIKLAMVSPELHATSPHLLGGESHQDAKDIHSLEARWREIIALAPDAICTDYPYRMKHLLENYHG